MFLLLRLFSAFTDLMQCPNFGAEVCNETCMRPTGLAGVGPCSLVLTHTHTQCYKPTEPEKRRKMLRSKLLGCEDTSTS